MVFLTQDDFKLKLSTDILNQIIQLNNSILDDGELQAIAMVEDDLSPNFDTEIELAKTGDDRHKNLIRWILNLTLYFVYERIPDDQVPERVVKNYDDTVKELEMIARGKKNTTLERVTDSETNETHTTFRAGSNPMRGHEPY